MEELDFSFEDFGQEPIEDTNPNGEDSQPVEDQMEDDPQEASLFPGESWFDDDGGEDDSNSEEGEASPTDGHKSQGNFYSSITDALVGDGLLNYVTDEDIQSVQDADSFAALMEKSIRNQLDERTRRVEEVLSYGGEPNQVRAYEEAIANLSSITDEALTAETAEAEAIRKDLIYYDLINRGYSEERAAREVNKSLAAGTDIEDAREALKGNMEYYQSMYGQYIEEQKAIAQQEEEQKRHTAEALFKGIVEESDFSRSIGLDNRTRSMAYENLTAPVYRDEHGNMYTAIQKAEAEDRVGFLRGLSIAFTLTDGFKDFTKLGSSIAKKEYRSKIKQLENNLVGSRPGNGNLSFVTKIEEDPHSYGEGKIILDM